MRMLKWCVVLVLVALCAPLANATPVGVELLLLVDVSGSIDAGEYAIQKSGYVSAFQSVSIQALISGVPGGVAVAYAEFSGSGQQSMLVNWTLLTDAASSNAFAAAISGSSRAYSGLTAPGSAINWGVPLFGSNGYEGNTLIIDVSGDGSENSGADTSTAAANAWLAGIQVNGLPIGGSSLQTWYQNNIVTPGHGFMVVASSFADFEPAIELKIQSEVSEIPEPATFLLLGSALLGLGLLRRRK